MKILVTGGAGYVGSVLVPELLERGYFVRVLDLFIYGDTLEKHPGLELIKGDIRDKEILKKAVEGCEAVIHLACISNDPSFDLDPALGESINLDAFEPLVKASKESGVKRFIYASSSSVYGIKETENVTEDMELEPLTDYSRFKAMCEEILMKYQSEDFTIVTIRPATVCGYSPRQRLDVIVNILTNHAIVNRKIKIFGGAQKRPNIHIKDMAGAYILLLEAPKENVAGRIFNAGYENHTVSKIADTVKKVIGPEGIELETVPTDDNRSYHISSRKIFDELGFKAHHTIEEAVRDLKKAFAKGLIRNSMSNPMYYNIKRMKEINLI